MARLSGLKGVKLANRSYLAIEQAGHRKRMTRNMTQAKSPSQKEIKIKLSVPRSDRYKRGVSNEQAISKRGAFKHQAGNTKGHRKVKPPRPHYT